MFADGSAAKPIPYRSTEVARKRAQSILREVCRSLKGMYRFNVRLVGSGHSCTMCDYGDGTYDLDYQLILTHNSRRIKDGAKPKKIKDDFYTAFNNARTASERFENSTTAITLKNGADGSKKYSIDFVILYQSDITWYIIRRNGPNLYTWNELPHRLDHIYRKFEELPSADKTHLREIIIQRKFKERNNPNITSLEIFVEEVNNYASGTYHRLPGKQGGC